MEYMTMLEAFKSCEELDDEIIKIKPKERKVLKESINEEVDDYYLLSDGKNPKNSHVFPEIKDVDEFIKNLESANTDMYRELLHFVNGKEKKIWDSKHGKVEESCKVEEDSNRELIPHFDSRNSFYNKARVVEKDDGTKILYSYATPVCRIKDNKATLLHRGYLGWNSSQTTLRHVKEFLKQNGFEVGSVKDLAKMYSSEQAVNEDYDDLNFSWNDICKEIIDKVKELTGKDITCDDIHFDDSRAWSLYVFGNKLGLPVYKFGAYRNYSGGGMRGPIEHNGRDQENTVALGEFFAEQLEKIEDTIAEESNNYSESLKEEVTQNNEEDKKLNENDIIDLNDKEDVKKAKEILSDNKDENSAEQIIDADAETIDKLKSEYVGNAVLICTRCKKPRFLEPEKLVKDEETELYNIEDECPNCHSSEGYDLGGQISKMSDEAEVKVTDEVKTEVEDNKDDSTIAKEISEFSVSKEDKESDRAHESFNSIDELDDEGLSKLITEALTSVYDNIDSYSVSDAEVKDEKLIVEGLINFKSGKTKNTEFVFESIRQSKNNKCIMKGTNTMLSESKNGFVLKGRLEDKKMICESLTCNYVTKVNEEEKLVRGRYTIKEGK